MLSEYDKSMIGWLKLFNKYDLYTKKEDVDIVTPKIEIYYNDLLDKYFKKN